MKSFIALSLLSSIVFLTACQKEAHVQKPMVIEVTKPLLEPEPDFTKPAKVAAAPTNETPLEKGKRIWTTVCIQCHNKDPNVKGAIGPETVDAPLEVMQSKVLTGKYPDPLPAGFVPKRKTSAMRPLPQHADDVPAIWEYVQSVKK